MTKIKTGIFFSLSLGSLLLGSLEGSIWENQYLQIEIDNGLRWDRIDEAYEVTDSVLIQPYQSAEHQYKNLASYQLGGRVFWDVSGWLFKANGHYGWIYDGNFNHDSFEVGRANKGHTSDISGAFGYAFPFCDCFSFAPYVGYSYDNLDLSLRHIRPHSPAQFSDNVTRGKFSSSFYGPWLGFDFLYETSFMWWDMCHTLSMNTGYEFHYGQARFKFREHFIDPDGRFAYHSKMNNMLGNVFHFDTRYHLPCNWLIGVEFQYAYWTNAHKHHNTISSDSDTGFTATQTQRTFKLRWQSINTVLTIGKAF
jgi:hypothetical protein